MEEYEKSLEKKEHDILEKLKKKKQDFERNEKKYKSMTSLKPIYIEELEIYEKELQRLFNVYVDKIRNKKYLEFLFEDINKQNLDKQN